ncbi:hypothetical protein I6E61_07875 [Psychrobacter sp. NZS113]|jgi:NADH:ubiquinone oxidoreductase subunit H|uniref:hypothetical protein n=1 Tax=Psychrobacter sp. NZS113 TaxID=2792045 RepID=UPI0018CE9F7F|nr:hypothetical protein [Psychrobacter sp. NZS113]MBH0096298.1 hypothetical protein [Psychrobacter sp. NZS113]
MTDLNKSNASNTDIAAESQIDRAAINSQQVSIKSWSQKILVVILCAASFYGGWKSYESNMVNECTANGGQMVEAQKTMMCQLS